MSLDPHKYEDTILKMAHTYFGTRGRKIFCVYGKNSSLIRNRYV